MGLLKIIFFLVIVLGVVYFLSGGDVSELQEKFSSFLSNSAKTEAQKSASLTTSTPVEEMPAEVAPVIETCRVNADCTDNKKCIEGTCGMIADLYVTDCEKKCTLKSLELTTSDGESYTLVKGQGGYTAAGAVEWKIVSFADYCPSEDLVIPINIYKKNYGKVVSEQVITLKEGETSPVITHPTVTNLAFTLKVNELKESCS